VIITTHYIEEARQANVVGLMRHGKILAEDSPDELMRTHGLTNLEDVFLKLCVTDSSHRAAIQARDNNRIVNLPSSDNHDTHAQLRHRWVGEDANYSHRWDSLERNRRFYEMPRTSGHLEPSLVRRPTGIGSDQGSQHIRVGLKAPITIHTGTNKIEINQTDGTTSESFEILSSEEEDGSDRGSKDSQVRLESTNFRRLLEHAGHQGYQTKFESHLRSDDYMALQVVKWATRRNNMLGLMNLRLNGSYGTTQIRNRRIDSGNGAWQWWETLMAVTWKNYVRLRRNPPVLIFQFMLPAIQVILFCLCIGGEPFDVPVAVVNDEAVPRSSNQFLSGLNKQIIRQIQYDNLTDAMEAVRRGKVWGAIHIPDRYSENLQSRLIMGEEVTSETISNGTIRVYPDLTSKYYMEIISSQIFERFF